MGLFDRAKELAEQAKRKAEEALAEAKSRAPAPGDGGNTGPSVASPGQDPRMGTPYAPGMLGRPGWREQGLQDPAAILPIGDRDGAGIPHTTRSEVLEEAFGMGRRWSSGGRSAGLFYRLHPDHQGWHPPQGMTPLPEIAGASLSTLDDGRTLIFFDPVSVPVVLEVGGLDDMSRTALARAVATKLAAT